MPEYAGKPLLLVVTSTYPRWPGDTEPAFVHQLASRLTDTFDVLVTTSRAPNAKRFEMMDGVRVHRYAYAPARWETLVYGGGLVGNLRSAPWKILLLPGYFLCWMCQIAALRRVYRINAVHAHWFIPSGLVTVIAARDVPVCVTAHGTDVLGLKGWVWRKLRKFIARKSSVITVVGKRIQDALTEEGIAGTVSLPMGTDLSGLFVPGEMKGPVSRVLFVGRLIPSKRPEVVLKVFTEVAKRFPQLELDFIGNGPEQLRLELLASNLGIRERVNFLGRRSQQDIAHMYRSASIAMVASGGDDAPEGLGLVAIEALGCGCPVVSAPNVALQAVLPKGAPIRYAKDGSVEALSEALSHSILSYEAEAVGVDRAWRLELQQTLGWERVAENYARLLEGMPRLKRDD